MSLDKETLDVKDNGVSHVEHLGESHDQAVQNK
jgi:hypothetical protein